MTINILMRRDQSVAHASACSGELQFAGVAPIPIRWGLPAGAGSSTLKCVPQGLHE
jgi:hypothetical protein